MAEEDWSGILFNAIDTAATGLDSLLPDEHEHGAALGVEALEKAHEIYCTSDEVLFDLKFARDGRMTDPEPALRSPKDLCAWIVFTIGTMSSNPLDPLRAEALARSARGMREAAHRIISGRVDYMHLQVNQLDTVCGEIQRVSLDPETSHISKAWQVYFLSDSTLIAIGETREGQAFLPPDGVPLHCDNPEDVLRCVSEQASFDQLPQQSAMHAGVHLRGLRDAAYLILDWYARESSAGSGSTFLCPTGLPGSQSSGMHRGRRSRSNSSGESAKSHQSLGGSKVGFYSGGAGAVGRTHLAEESWQDVARELPAYISECIAKLSKHHDPKRDGLTWADAPELNELVGGIAQLCGREQRRGAGSKAYDESSEIIEVLHEASIAEGASPASMLKAFKEEFG